MFIYLFQQKTEPLPAPSFSMARELKDRAPDPRTAEQTRVLVSSYYRALAWPVAPASSGRGREVRRQLEHWADHCPGSAAAWKVSAHRSHHLMAWEGWGEGEGAGPATTAAQPQQWVLHAGCQ